MIILGILVDTLQPPHLGIKQSYDYIAQQRGSQYTFIIATDKKPGIQSDITEPLTFKDKEQLLVKHGISTDKIIKANSLFDITELESRFDPDDTCIIFYFFQNQPTLGFKNDRILQWNEYYKDDVKPMSEVYYYQVLSDNIRKIQGIKFGTKLFIEELGDPENGEDNKKTFFALAFGWYDAGFYNLMKERFRNAYDKFTSKYSNAINQPSLEKSVNEISKIMIEDLELALSPHMTTSDDDKSPSEKARDKRKEIEDLRQKQKTLDLTKKRVDAENKLGKEKVLQMTKSYNDEKRSIHSL